jgi:hypothetical protein
MTFIELPAPSCVARAVWAPVCRCTASICTCRPMDMVLRFEWDELTLIETDGGGGGPAVVVARDFCARQSAEADFKLLKIMLTLETRRNPKIF